MRTTRRGFTLIELLVVIAIIAILAAILFPVFAKAREKARQAACASNIKQISLGMLQYVQDYDEMFPPSWVAAGSGNGLNLLSHWMILTHPYVKNGGVFDCPTSPDKVREDLKLTDGSNYDGNYGTNYDALGYTMKSMMAAIDRPSEMFMIGDSGDVSMCCNGANTWDQLMGDLDLDWVSGKEGANRHNGGANLSYCDGHVKWLSLNDMIKRPGQNQAPWFVVWEDNPPADNGSVPYPNR